MVRQDLRHENLSRQTFESPHTLWLCIHLKEAFRVSFLIHITISLLILLIFFRHFFSGHAESYNPPPEYLFDEKEMKEWHKFKDEPQRRKLHFMPQKFNSLREVPAYSRYIRERFLRCLDLYLCPRAKRMKVKKIFLRGNLWNL